MVLPFKLFLTIMFFSLLLYIVGNIALLLCGRNKKASFTLGFLVLCLLWTSMRATFWFSTLGVWHFAELGFVPLFFVFWLPTSLQFSVFSLLVLFYAKVVTRRDWHSKWKTLANTTYILGNATVCVFTGVWAVFAGLADSDATLSLMQSIYLGVAGVLFLLLSAMLATCGCRLTRLGLLETKRMFIFQRKTLVVVNALLTLVFTSRGVYNMLSAVDVSSVDIELDGREDVSMLGAVLFFLWEPFPMMLMLATMAKPTFRSVRTGAHHRPLIPPHGVYREIRGSAGSGSGGASLPPIVMESGRSLVAEDAIHTGTSWGQWGGGLDSSNLFENRHRYDSDQEDEAMEDSDSDYPPAGYSASPVAPLPGPRDGAYGRA